MGMARPGRTLEVAASTDQALPPVVGVFTAAGFTVTSAPGQWPVELQRGSTGRGVLVEAVSQVVPLWLLPAARRNLFAMGARIRLAAEHADRCALRVDLDRRSSASMTVDQPFLDILNTAIGVLEAAGYATVAGEVTDSAREPRTPA